jgi:hypothetical protein
MDELTEGIYAQYEKDPSGLMNYIKSFLKENGQDLINKRDSAGNRFIHNVCMALKDQDADILASLLDYMLEPATQTS